MGRPTSSDTHFAARVIVCGSRDWIDRELIAYVIAEHGAEHGDSLVIVHGAARGADRIADEEALVLGIATEAHPADWKRHGKAAGHIRNEEMAKLGAVKVEAFWDGKSRGTWNMIEAAKRHSIPWALHCGRPGGASLAAA